MTTAIQRPLKGSRITTFYPVKDLPSLASLDSAFQLQEYISLLVRLDPHDVEAITSLPGSNGSKDSSNDTAKGGEESEKAKSEVTVDQWCWVYEQLRRLAQDLTHPLITTLQTECTRASCPEMKAGEWLYLCVAHGNEGAMEQCCAIDYILHTLDSATALLNSPRAFPSRIQIPETSQRHFSSLARRLGRIFAHAYFHHREAFEQAEAESSLYARFLALTSKFDLVPAEFLPIPPEAFYTEENEERHPRDAAPPKLLAAGLEPQPASEGDHEQRQQQQQEQLKSILQHSQEPEASSQLLEPPRDATASPNPPGLAPEASPRRPGRNRTDTMVFSEAEAQSFAEQLTSRSGTSPERSSDGQEEEPQPTAAPAPPPLEKSFAEAVAGKDEESPPAEVDLVDLTDPEPSKLAEEAPTAAEQPQAEETGTVYQSADASEDEEVETAKTPAEPEAEDPPPAAVEEQKKEDDVVPEAAATASESTKAESDSGETVAATATPSEEPVPDPPAPAPAPDTPSPAKTESEEASASETSSSAPIDTEKSDKGSLAMGEPTAEDSKEKVSEAAS